MIPPRARKPFRRNREGPPGPPRWPAPSARTQGPTIIVASESSEGSQENQGRAKPWPPLDPVAPGGTGRLGVEGTDRPLCQRPQAGQPVPAGTAAQGGVPAVRGVHACHNLAKLPTITFTTVLPSTPEDEVVKGALGPIDDEFIE